MSSLREESKRKRELLDRYRAVRLEQLTEDLRHDARFEKEKGRFPWRGEFRDSGEIERLYKSRSRWGMRFSLDLIVLCVLLASLLMVAPNLIRFLI